MTSLDWNLLPGLHALLEEASVSRAAARVGVTVPSMSRLLGRLRRALGDPLLVRAGRQLVLTAHAVALRDRVARVTAEGRELLAAGGAGSLATVARTLVIRTNDGLGGLWLEPLVRAVRAQAPRLTLAFVSEGDERPEDLRDGRVDLDIGVVGDAAPELRTQTIGRDAFVAVVRRDHPMLAQRRTARRFAGYDHVGVSRRGRFHGPVDAALAALGLTRNVVATVPTATAAAVAIARSDWITGLPRILARALVDIMPIAWFEVPLVLPPITIAQTWHPRLDRDPAHRLLRACVHQVARDPAARRSSPSLAWASTRAAGDE